MSAPRSRRRPGGRKGDPRGRRRRDREIVPTFDAPDATPVVPVGPAGGEGSKADDQRAMQLAFGAGAGVGLLPAAVLGPVVGIALHPAIGFGAFLTVLAGVGGGLGWYFWKRAAARVLDMIGGRPADPDGDARLLGQVEGLAPTIGVAVPDVRVLDTDEANAFTVGWAGRGTIVVTRGLLDRLTVIQLEGVLARQMVQLRAADGHTAAVATAICASPLGRLGFVQDWVTGYLERDRQARADVAAVGVTRYPPGLYDAFEILAPSVGLPAGTPAFTGPMWLAGSHDDRPFAERAHILGEL